MNILKISIIFFFIISLISYSSGRESVHKEVPIELDKILASYPTYRIDDKINKICIIGSGEGKNEIANYLTKRFMELFNVKVVETGNIQAILGGKIIEYGTGLSHSESQALSQMLQIDHILLFQKKISIHRDYQYGGRGSVTINLKILNTLNGEVLYQSAYSYGFNAKDPRDYGYSMGLELRTHLVNDLFSKCLLSLTRELSYAMGKYVVGIICNFG